MATGLLNFRALRFTITLAGIVALGGCCEQRTPIPVGSRIMGERIRRTAVPDEDSVVAVTLPDPNTSGPHQTNIVITTKKASGTRPITSSDVHAYTLVGKRTILITVDTPTAFEPKPGP